MNEQSEANEVNEPSDLIPEGRYLGRVVATAFGLSKAGNRTMAVSAEITEEGAQKGRFCYGNLAFSGKSLDQITPNALRNMGYVNNQANALTLTLPHNEEASKLLPSPVILVIVHEVYEGKKSAKIAFFNSATGGLLEAKTPLTLQQRQQAAREITMLLGAEKSGAPKAQTRQAPPAPHDGAPGGPHEEYQGDDSDIPF